MILIFKVCNLFLFNLFDCYQTKCVLPANVVVRGLLVACHHAASDVAILVHADDVNLRVHVVMF